MDPVGAVELSSKRRRTSDTNFEQCFICQNDYGCNKQEKVLRNATDEGLICIKTRANERLKYKDVKYVNALDRIQALPEHTSEVIKWHKTCYSAFTNVTAINRLKKQFQSTREETSHKGIPEVSPSYDSRSSRSSQSPVSWEKCVFCQDENCKEKIHNVACLSTSDNILQLAQFDKVMRCRLAGVSDLIAAEGKYHLRCYRKFSRKYEKTAADSDKEDPYNICLHDVADELRTGLARGEIYSLNNVWERYCDLLGDFKLDAGVYRSQHFKAKLSKVLQGKALFVHSLNPTESLLVFPEMTADTALKNLRKFINVSQEYQDDFVGVDMIKDNRDTANMDTEILSWLYWVALKIRADIRESPSHIIIGGIDQQHAEDVVPESLYMLLRLLCMGETYTDVEEKFDEAINTKVLSVAQDIVYLASGGKKLTPKHIGIGVTVHQATRSKDLVQLLHAAGHCISYESVLRADKTIASEAVNQYFKNGEVYVPHNFLGAKLPGYIMYANDNIDINEETLDGKGTFHASQTAAFRRIEPEEASSNIKLSCTEKTVSIPPQMFELKDAKMESRKSAPKFHGPVSVECYKADAKQMEKASNQDLAWVLCRLQCRDLLDDQVVPSWSGFNHMMTNSDHLKTVAGVMPILNSPAHDYDTIWTVMQNCHKMTTTLGQMYTIITFDEQLYCKAKMLQWQHPGECEMIIILLGGFHVQMNFSKVIGQHLADSGLQDILEQSGVFGKNTAENIMKGNGWNRVVRAHKLAFEGLWRVLWPQFLQWLEEHERNTSGNWADLANTISNHLRNGEIEEARGTYQDLLLSVEKIQVILKDFDAAHCNEPTFAYWRQYMDLVSILLAFTRALRCGDWQLYIAAFKSMMPWFAVYDHTNYTRWGAVFIADMEQLAQTAPEVHEGFLQGDFVAKETTNSFNEVPFDLRLEHINKTGKVAGGLIGITRTETARNRWSITYNERASMAEDTRTLFGLEHDDGDDEVTHKDCLPSRLKRDYLDVMKLVEQFERYDAFHQDNPYDLVTLTTGDVATKEIQQDLTDAHGTGKQMVADFVSNRLVTRNTYFHDTLAKRKSKTFSTLYTNLDKSKLLKSSVVKADREVFQRIIVSMESGREVNLNHLLQKELCAVPLSLATADSALRSTNKAELAAILEVDAKETQLTSSNLQTCLIIDGMALVRAMGKPPNATTFDDYAAEYRKRVQSNLHDNTTRVDVVFDQYLQHSIKSGTRVKRNTTLRKIRTFINSWNVKLPDRWSSFIEMDDNKANLAQFLSNDLERNVHYTQNIIVSGGFDDTQKVVSTRGYDVSHLHANHEEADTQIVLDAADATNKGYERLIIQCRDTDVLLLLLVFAEKLSKEIWMQSGTAKKPRYIRVHDIKLPPDILHGLLAYHAITGSDSTSQFTGIGKKTSWKVFLQYPKLLHTLGEGDTPNEATLSSVEHFVCRLYDPKSSTKSIHEFRCAMFRKAKSNIDNLAPTKDALDLHTKRAHYQTRVWMQSLESCQTLPAPTDCGWHIVDGRLVPQLLTVEPLQAKCVEFTTCGCKETGIQCGTRQCACRKSSMFCTMACGCVRAAWCKNSSDHTDNNEEY